MTATLFLGGILYYVTFELKTEYSFPIYILLNGQQRSSLEKPFVAEK